MTDPVADMIIRLKNGYLVKKNEVRLPHSMLKENIANLLKTKQFIQNVQIEDSKPQKTLILTLRYTQGQPAVTNVKRLSSPGLRRYSSAKKIPRTLGGYGITIVSTSLGVLSDKQAKEKGVGGELLCSIW